MREESVQVIHRKKQQNLEPENSPNHIVVTWDLILSFHPEMHRMTDATLRLTDVKYNENMAESDRTAWDHKLGGGDMIVC